MSVVDLADFCNQEQVNCKDCFRLIIPQEPHICTLASNVVESSDRLGAYTVMSFTDERSQCAFCKRKFRSDRLERHEAACQHASRKRPTFDIKKKQFPQLGFHQSRHVASTKRNSKISNYSNTKWHKQHEDVVNKMRFGRLVETLEERGEDISTLNPPPNINENYVKCPYCFRRFAPLPAERHIPRCKDIIHKPSPPPHIADSSVILPKLQKNRGVKLYDTPSLGNSPDLSKIEMSKSPPVKTTTRAKKLFHKSEVSMLSILAAKVECPHCNRPFAPRAAERHIPICEKVRNKPKSFKPNESYTSFNKQDSYIRQNSKKAFKKPLLKSTEPCENCEAPMPTQALFCMMCGFKRIKIN